MSMTDIVSHAGLSLYTEIAMVLFMAAFLAIGVWTFWPSRRKELDRAAQLPLDDDTTSTPRNQVNDEPARR